MDQVKKARAIGFNHVGCVSSQLGPRTRIPAKLANMEWFSRLLSGLARLSAFVREVRRGNHAARRERDSRMIVQTS
jgi:hypothetical protein